MKTAMTRDQLKAIMREIFLELLSEGFGNIAQSSSSTVSRSNIPEQRTANGRRKPEFDSRLDTSVGSNRIPTSALKEAVRLEAKGNPEMARILADTAVTTLASQLAQGDRLGTPMIGSGVSVSRNSSPVQQEQFNGSPEEIFDGGRPRADGSSHWADLAFTSNKKTL